MVKEDNKAAGNLCQRKDLFKDRWKVISKLGAGGFGQIYLAKDRQLNCNVALKVESSLNRDKAQLPIELQVMKRYQNNTTINKAFLEGTVFYFLFLSSLDKPHAAELLGAGLKDELNFVVMQLLGLSLAKLRKQCPTEPKRFPVGTTLRLGQGCTEAVRDLHDISVIHRDIKPSNFTMGSPETPHKNTVYMLDFGLTRFFTDAVGNIRPARNVAGFRGTMRYASLASNEKKELGRKDDLISLFYMISECWTGLLPWKDQKSHNEVVEAKKQNSLDKMATELHAAFSKYVAHVDKLNYLDKPDYSILFGVFTEIMTEKNVTD